MKKPKNFPPPPMPPETPEETAAKQEECRILAELTAMQRQRNLDNAVLLAQQAARGHGELIDHFKELGRRFGHTLSKPRPGSLRVIEGGMS